MKEFFIGFILGVAVTAATGGYFIIHKKEGVRHAQDLTASAFQRAADAFEAKRIAWHLTGDDIEKELTNSGKVVRRQMGDFGTNIADKVSDGAITAKIKSKFVADKDVPALSIGVITTDGRVTLTGNVTSNKQISKAMMIALETDGVREVSSTLRVKQ